MPAAAHADEDSARCEPKGHRKPRAVAPLRITAPRAAAARKRERQVAAACWREEVRGVSEGQPGGRGERNGEAPPSGIGPRPAEAKRAGGAGQRRCGRSSARGAVVAWVSDAGICARGEANCGARDAAGAGGALGGANRVRSSRASGGRVRTRGGALGAVGAFGAGEARRGGGGASGGSVRARGAGGGANRGGRAVMARGA